MLDKNTTIYEKINNEKIISGQDGKTGMWYCKELPCETVNETKTKIDELNQIYNDYNKQIKEENEKKEKK